MSRVFFDHQAGTPVLPEVLAAMLPWFTEEFGSPASFHQGGLRARDALNTARDQFARLLNAESPENILFTSGGTEAVNLAVKGAALGGRRLGRHVVYSAAEHPAVTHSIQWLETQGFTATRVPVGPDGTLAVDAVRAAITEETILLCTHHANFDLGTLQPVAELGALAAERGLTVFVDANTSGGWLPIDVQALGVQLLSLSPHRFHGPKGVGVLYRHRRTPVSPVLHGGLQEDGRRPGTENVPAIVGAGVAAELAGRHRAARLATVRRLQAELWAGLVERVPRVQLNGPPPGDRRLPNNLHFSVPGIEGEAVVLRCDLKGIALHSGTACLTRSMKLPPVLAAIGLPPDLARSAVLLSLSHLNTDAEVRQFLAVFPAVVAELRAMLPGGT